MVYVFLIAAMLVCAIQVLRARRLITSALWLAGVSAMLSIVFYLMGAHQVAVIELSVGAGLVTVLFVFAINIASAEIKDTRPLVPRPLAWALVAGSVLLLGWLSLPLDSADQPVAEPSFVTVLWQQRGLDVLVQIVLIFAGVLGLLGLLAEAKAPLQKSVAEQVTAKRDRELLAMQQQALDREKELA